MTGARHGLRTALVAMATAAAAVVGLPTAAVAQSFDCSGRPSSLSDRQDDVRARCGEPAMQRSFCRVPDNLGVPGKLVDRPSIGVPCRAVDEWIYPAGADRAATTLRFETGRLRSIGDTDR